MKYVIRGTVAALAAVLVLGCSDKSTGDPGPPGRTIADLTSAEKELCESGSSFGLRLFREIVNQADPDSNIFVSPLSVSMALGMTYNGAAGSTQVAMQSTLELSGLSLQEVNESYQSLMALLTQLDPKVRFQIANSIWYRLGLPVKEEFIKLNRTYFDAEVAEVDFADLGAADRINAWVKSNTGGKIPEIVESPIAAELVMFLINAIYFKGAWASEFDPEETVADQFILADGTQQECRMMRQTEKFGYFEDTAFQAIDLPYGDGSFSMAVFLPKPSSDVNTVTSEFTEENWSAWTDSFSSQEVALQMPKFTFEYAVELKDVLSVLGMGIAFEEYAANFSGISDSAPGNLYISKVKHKAFVEVNEEGTEAAAVTSVGVGATSMPPQPMVMRVDRPFLFVIWERGSSTILFMGRVMSPTER